MHPSNIRKNSTAHSSRYRSLIFEFLESRQLLAGNVAAYVSGGDLYVVGDGLANAIAITQVAANSYRLIAGVDQNNEPTTVNGMDQVQIAARGNLRIRLQGGPDILQIYDINTRKDIFVDLGAGRDSFNDPFSGPGRVLPDNVTARNVYLNDSPTDGAILAGWVRDFQVDNFFADFGPGSEDIVVQGLRAGNSVVMRFGEGGSELTVAPGDGGITARNLTLQAGGGDSIDSSTGEVLRDYFGDRWNLHDVAVDRFVGALGRAHDWVTHGNLVARQSFLLDGGPGIDRWDPIDGLQRSPAVVNFEFQIERQTVVEELQFLLQPGQSQQQSSTAARSFITDYQVTHDGAGRPVVTPVETEVITGLDATAKVESDSDDLRELQVSVNLTGVYLDEVWRTAVPLPGGRVAVQQPQVGTLSLATTASVPDGGTVLLGGGEFSRNWEVLNLSDYTTLWEVIHVEHRNVLGITAVRSNLQATVTPNVIRGDQGELTAVQVAVRVALDKIKAVPRQGGSSQARDAQAGDRDVINIVVRDGETKTVSRQTNQPFLTSYEIATRRPGQHVVDPVISPVETGTTLTATANVSPDRRYVRLDVEVLRKVLNEVAPYGVSGPFGIASIQLPTVAETQISTTVFVPDGGTVLLGSVQDGDELLQVLVTPHIIIGEEELFAEENLLANAASDLQVSLEVRTVRTTENESRTYVQLNAIDGETADLKHAVHQQLVSDLAVVTLVDGIRTVKPVVTGVDRQLEMARVPAVFPDESGAHFDIQYRETTISRNRYGLKLTPFGVQYTRRVELSSLATELAAGIPDGEPISFGPFADSRGRSFSLLTGRFIVVAEDSDVPLQSVVDIKRLR